MVISWTLNTSSRHKDTVSVDFIAALLLPLVAAGHLVFQVARLPASVAEVITAQDVEMQMYASALEAPLNICETFSVAALLLNVCCGPWWDSDPKWQGLGLVLVVGLLSWGTDNVMFTMATMRGVRAVDVTLSRPYLFFLTPIVVSTWCFLALCSVVWGALWIHIRVSSKKVIRRALRRRPARSYQLPVHNNVDHSDHSSRIIFPKKWEKEWEERVSEKSRNFSVLSYLTVAYLPLTFIICLCLSELSSANLYPSQFLLIPRSNGSMSNLDQILALVGGIIILLAATRHAYRSRAGREPRSYTETALNMISYNIG